MDLDLRALGKSAYTINHIAKWNSTDNPSQFLDNMSKKDKAAILQLNGHSKENIEYRYNNLGFRSDDDYNLDSPSTGVMFLGCSFTIGVGLNIEDTWAYKLSKLQGGCFYNFAQEGSGAETAYRMLLAYAERLKIKRVYHHNVHDGHRREFYDGFKWKLMGPWSYDACPFVSRYMTHPLELYVNSARMDDAMIGFSKRTGIEIFRLDREYEMQAVSQTITNKSYGRDLLHYGKVYHDIIIADMSQWRPLI